MSHSLLGGGEFGGGGGPEDLLRGNLSSSSSQAFNIPLFGDCLDLGLSGWTPSGLALRLILQALSTAQFDSHESLLVSGSPRPTFATLTRRGQAGTLFKILGAGGGVHGGRIPGG